MKWENTLVDGFFWLCNAVTLLASGTFSVCYLLFIVFMEPQGPRLMGFSQIATFMLCILYSGFAAWKTGKYVFRPNSEHALNFLWLWAGALVVYFLIFMLNVSGSAPGSGG